MSNLESKVKKQFDSKFDEIKKQVTENSDSEEEKRPKRAKTSFNLNQDKSNSSQERKRTK